MKKIKYLAKNFFKAKRMKTLAMLLFCGEPWQPMPRTQQVTIPPVQMPLQP